MIKWPIVLITLLIILFTCESDAQDPAFRWATAAGDTSSDGGLGIAVDQTGNTYVAGYFGGDSITFGTTVLTNAGPGQPDMFLVKYDPHKNVIWARSAGGPLRDKALDVVVDAAGRSYVAGYFVSPSIVFGSDTLTNPGGRQIFLAKYNTDGNVVWARSAGGPKDDQAQKVCLDGAGHCYIVGYFGSDTISFGPDTLYNVSSLSSSMFVAKFDTSGNCLWARSSGGGNFDNGAAVKSDAALNIYVAGYFTSPTITFGSTVLTNHGSGNTFLVKYDQTGNVIWANGSSGSPSFDAPYAIAVSASGISTLAGYTYDSFLQFGADTIVSAYPSNLSPFAVQYDSAGNVRWTRGGWGLGDALAVAMDDGGNSYIGGRNFYYPMIIGEDTLQNAGLADLFVAKIGEAGNIEWAMGGGGSGSDEVWGMTSDKFGNIYITGDFTSSPLTLGHYTLNNAGSWDVVSAMIGDSLVSVQRTIGGANRWSMLSVPLTVPDYGKNVLFPTAVSNAFAYEGAYTAEPILRNGAGYWIAFNGAQDITMTGVPRMIDTIAVVAGWNLIGSISYPVLAGSIGSIPGGIVTSQYFGYAGSYTQRDTIRPGEAYWVKASQAGSLILTAGPGITPSSARIHIQNTTELPPSPPEVASASVSELPKEFSLGQNYPNPFNPTTVIKYELPVSSHVDLKVYDVLGRVVATLVDDVEPAGFRSIQWNASNVASGLYFYRVQATSTADPGKAITEVRKMEVVK